MVFYDIHCLVRKIGTSISEEPSVSILKPEDPEDGGSRFL
jgi:hypothetical protein